MALYIDKEQGQKVASFLYNAFQTTGIHGRKDMPEDILPKGIQKGSLEHLIFITLTTSIDYTRDANELWEISRKVYENPSTRYLFDLSVLPTIPLEKVEKDMKDSHLSQKGPKDNGIWKTVAETFQKKWNGDPRNFLESCNWNPLEILNRLKNDSHDTLNGRCNDFPYLRGPKIGPLWLRMLKDNVGILGLQGFDLVPIPVDIHIARSTFTLGIIRGTYSGSLSSTFDLIREAWFQSVQGLFVDDRPMIALDLDEPLWHLSKYGCTDRSKDSKRCPKSLSCETKNLCIEGEIYISKEKKINIRT